MKITFLDKVSTIISSLPLINRITADNINEIKTVVNYNDDAMLPIGGGCDYYGTELPSDNYMWGDGSEISRTTYAKLFARIGTKYGAGDGSTTFNLPDKRECVSIMYKEGSTNGTSGATLGTLGAKGGEFKHTQLVSEIGAHIHIANANSLQAYSNTPIGYLSSSGSIAVGRQIDNQNQDFNSAYTGESQSFNIMQKYIVCNYIIRVK